jgi:hypothetical protein
MHNLRSIRRLALGAAIAGAAIGAVPALASASSCTYDPANGGSVTVNDTSGALPLRVSVHGTFIAVDETDDPKICSGPAFALTTNTNLIKVRGTFSSSTDSLIVDQSEGRLAPGTTPETDGSSEVEVNFNNAGGPRGNVHVIGTPQTDVISVVGKLGNVNLSQDFLASDNDLDVIVVGGNKSVDVDGGSGPDLLSGNGLGTGSAAVTGTPVPVFLSGGPGNDALLGGAAATDHLLGGADDDFINSRDGALLDTVLGGFGDDTAFMDSDENSINSVEHPFKGPVGSLRMAPRVLRADAGMIARLKVSWKHPQSWRDVRKLKVSLYDGKRAVGMINARPAAGRLTGTGVVDLVPSSALSHHGNWVDAKLALDVPKSLAGKRLRVDVQAIDKDGHKQLERAAGIVRVAE